MAFWDDAKKKVLQVMKPRQQEGQQMLSNRADGGFSGYQPKMNRPQTEPVATGHHQAAPGSFAGMVPSGVDTSMMQQFQPVGGQTGAMPPAGQAFPQGAPFQGMPQQPQQPAFGRTGYQPVMQPRPQAQFQGSMPQQQGQVFQHQGGQQATRPGFGQPAFGQGNVHQQSAPQPAAPQAAANDGHTFAFPGDSYVVDGHAYKLVFRVAQITGVPSCFRVIEFMYNNEAVIVNAEQITDLVEADRCMDLIFGAACAMKQRLMRVSGKQIYVITPPQVYVAPFENLRRAGMADIERRWPGALQANMQAQPAANNVQQMTPPMYGNQKMGFQPRQDDFAGGLGRRAARNAGMNTNGYTDYGGFGMKSR